jgi:hypothetical protein
MDLRKQTGSRRIAGLVGCFAHITPMFAIWLLVLGIRSSHALFAVNGPLGRIPGRLRPAESNELEACRDEGSDSLTNFGKCCGKYPDGRDCDEPPALCKTYYETHPDVPPKKEKYINEFPKFVEEFEGMCEAYCDEIEKDPDWCPGLSVGAIIGIVVGSVVGVGAVAGALVYFLVIRPKKAAVATGA